MQSKQKMTSKQKIKSKRNTYIGISIAAVFVVAITLFYSSSGDLFSGNLSGLKKISNVQRPTAELVKTSSSTMDNVSIITPEIISLSGLSITPDAGEAYMGFMLKKGSKITSAQIFLGGPNRKMKINTDENVYDSINFADDFTGSERFNKLIHIVASSDPNDKYDQLNTRFPIDNILDASMAYTSSTEDGISRGVVALHNVIIKACNGALCKEYSFPVVYTTLRK